MTPQDFITKWRNTELKERSASQSHFIDLCRLLDIEDPTTADQKGEWFTFEKGASKTSGGEGWADVWRKDCFAWEYKGKRANLDKAFDQLLQYAIALENPPLLIVSDMDVIRIHTNWTNTVQQVHTLTLDDLKDAANRDKLRNAFLNPEVFIPTKTRQMVTEQAAQNFANLAQRLRKRGHDPQQVAHFVNRLVFCMFAEDVELLPNKMFERMIKAARPDPASFAIHAKALFSAMKDGGLVGFERVDWFNGGLFDNDDVLPLEWEELDDLIRAAHLDWSDIDPSILGTLFERGLDPAKRSQLGAHYTDRDKIMQIVNPVIVEPLLAEWAEVKAQIEDLIDKAPKATKDKLLSTSQKAAVTRALDKAEALHQAFLDRLKAFRVLDPACGSGNFLYIALLELKNIEHRVNLEAEALGLPRGFPQIGPEVVLGIELSAYAAELARVSVWIGEIQWMRRNGFEAAKNPILRSLKTIENRDALLHSDGTATAWPKSDVIVGNPPFLGGRGMKQELGTDYVNQLRKAYDVPGAANFVMYWFRKAGDLLAANNIERFGLVASKEAFAGSGIKLLTKLYDSCEIIEATSNIVWPADDTAVRVNITIWERVVSSRKERTLDGKKVAKIHPNVKGGETDLTQTQQLAENLGVAFIGVQPSGQFDVSGELARSWLTSPLNVHGEPNCKVLRPYWNTFEIVRKSRDVWIIDFDGMNLEEAALFEAPFGHLSETVGKSRLENKSIDPKTRDWLEKYWHLHWRPRPEMRGATANYSRIILTPFSSKYRVFVFADESVLASNNLVAIARDDYTFFGVLESEFHRRWSLAKNMDLGKGGDPRYPPTMTFETFPFPEGLTPNIPATDYADDPSAIKIAAAAQRLNELRENWLNPADLVDRVPEVVPGYPDRILPKNEAAAKELKKRTLTNLYNARPAWLDHAHKALDEAVAEAYGWGDEWRAGVLTEDEILARLFKLNQERAAKETS
ncbi:class I SAM-dependent DNA methyltransferase [Marivita sp.]|uniref:class I SAM-dependent DNA methyltransferase n=1 Tax=Marivita sp. TaxID=2003365 RepID=UPI003B52688D